MTYIYIWIVIGIIYGDGDCMGIIWIIWITWNIFIIWIFSGYYMDIYIYGLYGDAMRIII